MTMSSANLEQIQDKLKMLTEEISTELCQLESVQRKELLSDFVSALFLNMAKQDQREFCSQKAAEGIAAAKASGVRFGRGRIKMPKEFDGLADQWSAGLISARKAASQLGISHHTFLKCAREHIST